MEKQEAAMKSINAVAGLIEITELNSSIIAVSFSTSSDPYIQLETSMFLALFSDYERKTDNRNNVDHLTAMVGTIQVTTCAEIGEGLCDHEYVYNDESFAHAFGTEKCGYWACRKCDEPVPDGWKQEL